MEMYLILIQNSISTNKSTLNPTTHQSVNCMISLPNYKTQANAIIYDAKLLYRVCPSLIPINFKII